jgi:hypothetical protein
MTVKVVLALAAAAFAAAAPGSPSRPRPQPIVSLTASPSTLAVSRGRARSVRLTNLGSSRLVVRVRRSGLAVDLRGRPRLVRRPAAGRNAAPWLSFRPRELAVPAGASRVVDVAVRLPKQAQPGDHHAALVFSTLPLDRVRVGVRLRLAVRVAVRAPGVVRRRVVLRWLRVRRVGRTRRLELRLANRGNVTEELTGRVTISLATAPRIVVPVPGRRELLPGREGVLAAVYRGRYRGIATARVEVRGGGVRSFRIRL